jgi:pantetheine-phosphate adenylyltransferase
MQSRTAIYPGSFDPPTFGHIDLIERASRMFDTLIVAVAHNPDKAGLFSVEERIDMLTRTTRHLPSIEVTSFTGLTADFARHCNAIAIVRGLRVVSDFEYEITMAIANQKLSPRIDTVCLMPSERYLLLSSRIVREIAAFGGNVSEFVPHEVEQRLQEKLGRR